MKIVLSGGGTGGHIAPLASIAAALSKRGQHQLHYIGEGTELETRLLKRAVPASHRIMAGKFRRYRGSSLLAQLLDVKTLALNIRDFFKFAIGFLQSLWLLLRLRPEVVFSKGGYVALPVGLAAVVLRIPLVTHDSDTTPGLTNRVLERFAAAKACGFPRQGSIFTGNPLRDDILRQPAAAIETSKPIVMFLGGSSGAATINRAVFDSLDRLTRDYFVVHITGLRDFEAAPTDKQDYQAYDFVDEELGGLIKAADVVVSRAGANAITELAACAKPTILVPASHLTAGQQLENARLLESKKAAFVLNEAELATDSLLAAITHTLGVQDRFSRNIQGFYRSDAADELATLIIQTGEKR